MGHVRILFLPISGGWGVRGVEYGSIKFLGRPELTGQLQIPWQRWIQSSDEDTEGFLQFPFSTAEGPRAQFLTRPAESSAAPGAARRQATPHAHCCACGGSRPAVRVCADSAGGEDLPGGVAPGCGRTPAGQRGAPASDSPQRLLRSGEAEVLQDPRPPWDGPAAGTFSG